MIFTLTELINSNIAKLHLLYVLDISDHKVRPFPPLALFKHMSFLSCPFSLCSGQGTAMQQGVTLGHCGQALGDSGVAELCTG